MMGELGKNAISVGAVQAFERFADPEMELGPSHGGELIVEGAPN
jgi:hypothetical protein